MDIEKFCCGLGSIFDPSWEKACESKFNFKVGGWCGAKLMEVFNFGASCLEEDEQYLEIGTFEGASLIGALYNNSAKAQVFDPFNDGGKSRGDTPAGTYRKWLENCKTHNVLDRVTLHKQTCESFDGDLPKIGLFYYDGHHDSGHTYEALTKFEKFLSNTSIILVDDLLHPVGTHQQVYPGWPTVTPYNVYMEAERWVNERDHVSFLGILPYSERQAVLKFERKFNDK